MAEINNTAGFSQDRSKVILDSCYQVEKILDAMRRSARVDTDGIQYLVDGLVPRLLHINAVIMTAASSADNNSPEELRALLNATQAS